MDRKMRTYKLNFVKGIAFLIALMLISCGHEHSGNGHSHGEEKHDGHSGHKEMTNHVELTPAQVRNADIKTGRIQRMSLANSIKATGKLELPPQNKAGVSAMVGGQVKRVEVIQGSKVEEGEMIAMIADPGIVQMQQELLENKSRLSFVKEEFQRVKELYEDSIGAERQFQKTRSELESLKAKVSGMEKKLEAIGIDASGLQAEDVRAGIPVRSPINGYVSRINVKMGSYVNPGDEMFEVLDNHHVHIDLMVYEKDIHKVRKGQAILFEFTNRSHPEPLKAEVFAVGNSFDEDNKVARVHAEIKEKGEHFFPGMYVEAMIQTDSVDAQVLPESAVIREKEEQFIFVQESASSDSSGSKVKFRRIPVRAGVTDKGYTEFEPLGDLPQDANVVTKGGPFLMRHLMKHLSGGHSH